MTIFLIPATTLIVVVTIQIVVTIASHHNNLVCFEAVLTKHLVRRQSHFLRESNRFDLGRKSPSCLFARFYNKWVTLKSVSRFGALIRQPISVIT